MVDEAQNNTQNTGKSRGEGRRKRHIVIALPDGSYIRRVDYIRKRWEEGVPRTEIAAELSALEGREVTYQDIYPATVDRKRRIPAVKAGAAGSRAVAVKATASEAKAAPRITDILVLNGPNLNLLGTRQTEIYGTDTLKDIESLCRRQARKVGSTLDFVQTNSEYVLIEHIQQARGKYRGIILNAAAYTHTSIALMDAIVAGGLPVVEVHLSNLFKREEFRHKSYISPVAVGMICGFGGTGYALAIQALARHLEKMQASEK